MRHVARLLPEGVGSPARGLAPSVLCGALAGLAVVGQAALLSRALHAAFLAGAGLAALAPLLGALAATAAVRALLAWLQELLAQRYSAAARRAVRDRLVRRLLALGPRYATGERTGELANTLLGGVEALDAYLAQYLPQSALALVVPALVLAAVLWRDPPSAFVLLVTFPLVPLFMWLIGSAAEARTRRQWETLSRLAARFHDALAGLATLRAFGRADDECRLLEADSERHRALTMDVLRLAMASALALEALATLGTAVVAVEVGLRLLYARLAFRDAFFVLVLAPEFYKPLRTLGAAFHAGLAGREAAGRMAAILDRGGPLAAPALVERAAAAPRADARSSAERPPRVRFESVRLLLRAGEARARRLHARDRGGYDARARRGDRSRQDDRGPPAAAIPRARRSAACSSTTCRFRRCAPEDWRRRVAWVPQQPRLFHGTLRENLLLGRPDATPAAVERSLELAGLEELVRQLPRGLETPVARGRRAALRRRGAARGPGAGVPAGRSARRARRAHGAARSRRPSHGSSPAVGELRRGRTVLLIAHRLTTVAAADRVAVVSQGRLIEQGTPAALAESGSVYPRLLAAWRGTA